MNSPTHEAFHVLSLGLYPHYMARHLLAIGTHAPGMVCTHSKRDDVYAVQAAAGYRTVEPDGLCL